MSRALASIRQIRDLEPIPKADRIEIAAVDGWECIVKKDEFEVEHLCVYFEIDSFLPIQDRYNFLEKTRKLHQGNEGYRVKTMKMRGCISQGLALPLSTFPEIVSPTIGQNVTELLGVTKYDVSKVTATGNAPTRSDSARKFPSFIPKTDQERVQNLSPLYWKKHEDTVFEKTLKLDGSSCTIYKVPAKETFFEKVLNGVRKLLNTPIKHKTRLGVCSRNVDLKEGTCNFWTAARNVKAEENLPVNMAIQGELLAPNIQGNYEKVTSVEYYVYDVFDIEKQRYLSPDERLEFCVVNGFPHVPIVDYVRPLQKNTLKDLLSDAIGQGMNEGVRREGYVYKSYEGKTSFKVISNEYLLKHED